MKTIIIKHEALNDIMVSKKIFEARLNKPFFKDIKIGDCCVFKDSKRFVICYIEDILSFNSFEHALSKLDFRKFNSRTEKKEDTISIYNNLYANKYSNLVLVFKIKKIS